ncbi:MAG: hypothetical protein EXS05_09970 [Planctomycetaceae bacterium]|nr:hypothetical protein [Planctomycetaceae bacterium]
MLNRPLNALLLTTDAAAPGWEAGRHPRGRLAALFGVLMVAFLGIAARLVFVQTQLGDVYAAEFEKTSQRREPIPSRDGRILSADGQVLAEDVVLYGLAVHYRWLEEPVDPGWLRQQVLARLDRIARRDPQRVAAESAALLERREALWHRLERATGLGQAELAGQRRAIQRRVEQVYELVERGRDAEQSDRDFDARPAAESAWWQTAWQTVVTTLTTPPQREALEPLVIQEQLDYHRLMSEIPLARAVEIESHPERYPGTRIETRTRRVYPQGPTAAHVVGYRTPVGDDAIRVRRQEFPKGDPLDYQAGDRQGRSGLEQYYERHLRGLRGERRVVFNRRGEIVESRVVREPRYGHDLMLSLNLPLQQACEQLLDEQLQSERIDPASGQPLPIPPGGALVAIDVRTGAVLAAASAPRFDLGLLGDSDRGRWSETLADPRKPLFHRAAAMTLPPGSVFKAVSAAAFLESGRLDPEREFACQGYLDQPDRYRCYTFRHFGVGHGDVNLVSALARSCNVYFFAAARRIGPQPLYDWASKFGFGQLTGIDLPGEAAGQLPPDPRGGQNGTLSKKQRATAPEPLQLAIGQSKLTATPLQVARMIAAFANGGRLVTPRLADSAGPAALSTQSADATALPAVDPVPIPELSSRTLQWLRMGLQQVVAHPQGTGYKTVRLESVAIAGKTGTAESGGGRPDHAWFAGYVPAERPRIAFVVVLEHAGSGGHAAGPVAREFVEALLALGLLDAPPIQAPSAN